MPISVPLQTSVTPALGSIDGGYLVTIGGLNFAATPTVKFGATSATSVVFINSTTLTCRVPAHAVGAVNVTVTNPDTGVCTATLLFTFIATQWAVHRFDVRMRREQTS